MQTSTKPILLSLLLAFTLPFVWGQKVVSGPIQGHTTNSSTKILLQTKEVESVRFELFEEGISDKIQVGQLQQIDSISYKTTRLFETEIGYLKEGKKYTLKLYAGDTFLAGKPFQTTTKDRRADVNFLVGSCAYIGTGKDKFYKLWNSTRIFKKMAKDPRGEFMLWMGDHVYLMGNEYKSKEAATKRYAKVRQHKKLNQLMQTRYHYATWDDHDYGPNNCDGNFDLKHETRPVFEAFWPNPEPAKPDYGIFYKISKGDVDIFMLDDRYNRNDSEKGKKTYLGQVQMDWLKEELQKSNATFKIIVSGNQVLNQYEDHESFMQYPEEQKELFEYIRRERIEGVVFFSGDRHHSEVLTWKENGLYPLYDLTCSGLTSWRYPWRKISKERKNDRRVGPLINRHNYGVVNVSGAGDDRTLKMEFTGKSGQVFHTFSIKASELRF